MTTPATRQVLRAALDAYRLRAETAETRARALDAENALLKRALAMLTHSLADTTDAGRADNDRLPNPQRPGAA